MISYIKKTNARSHVVASGLLFIVSIFLFVGITPETSAQENTEISTSSQSNQNQQNQQEQRRGQTTQNNAAQMQSFFDNWRKMFENRRDRNATSTSDDDEKGKREDRATSTSSTTPQAVASSTTPTSTPTATVRPQPRVPSALSKGIAAIGLRSRNSIVATWNTVFGSAYQPKEKLSPLETLLLLGSGASFLLAGVLLIVQKKPMKNLSFSTKNNLSTQHPL
jgi:hypothetical protein